MHKLIRVTILRPDYPSDDDRRRLVEETERDMLEHAELFYTTTVIGRPGFRTMAKHEVYLKATFENMKAAHGWGSKFKEAYPHEDGIFCLVEWVDNEGGYIVT